MVCRYHGGGAPQVQKKARERLEALVDPAINQYKTLLKSKHHPTRLGAVKDILDRTGYKPTERIEQTNYTAEEIEQCERLTPDELDQYIALRRKLTQPGSSTGSPEAPGA